MKNTPISKPKTLPKKGLSRQKIIKQLSKRLGKDFTYDSGRIVGSMCTNPNRFARFVYAKYLEKNLGDLGLFPNTAQIEKEAIQMLGSLLALPQAAGNIVSGGTEANILALWAARNSAIPEKDEIVLPETAHFCFDKAADLLRLKLIKIRLNGNFQVDCKEVKNAINQRTLAIVGIAGTTDLGVVDPIPELAEIALANNLHLHIDAAFGGFVLPFLKNNCRMPNFDFRLPGVSSITIDPHKMGLAPIPAGAILFRNAELLKKIQTNVGYLAGGESPQTMLGTKPGASAIAVWSVLKYMGTKGYKKVVRGCMALTQRFVEEIETIPGINLVTKPAINVIGIRSDLLNIFELANLLRRKGWAVALFPNHIRIVIMPHIRPIHITLMIRDLKSIMRKYLKKGR
ncbi:MAG: tyrosine decarboxylase MfnA [candidate division WOR-3 bacterium]|nr:tyrosine decarboxylase MfnA [candidate division WOR-3 bacterium]